MYAASFFLVAAGEIRVRGDVVPGYTCAYVTLVYPWVAAKSLHDASLLILVRYFAVAVAGLINPVFLVAAIRRGLLWRALLLSMIPSCWIVFYFEKLYPREGHALWVAGMLFVLFSDRGESSKGISRSAES
jgi:hypothetical protein